MCGVASGGTTASGRDSHYTKDSHGEKYQWGHHGANTTTLNAGENSSNWFRRTTELSHERFMSRARPQKPGVSDLRKSGASQKRKRVGCSEWFSVRRMRKSAHPGSDTGHAANAGPLQHVRKRSPVARHTKTQSLPAARQNCGEHGERQSSATRLAGRWANLKPYGQ